MAIAKTLKYSGVVISHGETIEEVPEFVPKSTWKTRGARSCKSFKDFFAKQHRFGRSPFAEMPTSGM